jgi:hypothetical protein
MVATKKAAAKKSVSKPKSRSSVAAKGATSKKPSVSITAEDKDPEGGRTQAGRDAYNSKTGSHLKPGVKGPTDTPEKKRRKGSFLTRHFTSPRGPVIKDGEPTRQALQAAAWGEPVPKTAADEKKLAAKGRKLLDQYKKEKEKA